MTSSTYSKSSNSSRFIPIFKIIHEIICKKVIFKRRADFFCFFVVGFILCNNIQWWTFFRNRKTTKIWNNLKSIFLKKISAQHFEDLTCTNKLEGFFFFQKRNFFSRTCSFLHECKTTNSGVVFVCRKIILYFFSRVII